MKRMFFLLILCSKEFYAANEQRLINRKDKTSARHTILPMNDQDARDPYEHFSDKNKTCMDRCEQIGTLCLFGIAICCGPCFEKVRSLFN